MPVQSHKHATLHSSFLFLAHAPSLPPSAPLSSLPAPDLLSTLVAFPYDVLDAAAKQRLLDKNPKNIVAIDLPRRPGPRELGPPRGCLPEGRGTSTAPGLKRWTSSKSLRPTLDVRSIARPPAATPPPAKPPSAAAWLAASRPSPSVRARAAASSPTKKLSSGPKEDRFLP